MPLGQIDIKNISVKEKAIWYLKDKVTKLKKLVAAIWRINIQGKEMTRKRQDVNFDLCVKIKDRDILNYFTARRN